MHSSKFIDILKTFSREEMKQFRDFLHSPFHNSNKNVMKLFDLTRKFAPGFDSSSMTKEKIFKKLYPGKKFNDIVIRILISDLLRLAEEFISYKRFLQQRGAIEKNLLEELKDRKLDSLFNKHFKEAEKSMSEDGIINEEYFINWYGLEGMKVNYLISKDKQDESGVNLLKKGEYLVSFALISILNIVPELKEHEVVLNDKFDFNLAKEFLDSINTEKIMAYMKKNNFRYYPVIEIYNYMYLFARDKGNKDDYTYLNSLVQKNLKSFQREEQYNLFLILESCLLTLLRYGNLNSYKDLMDLYRLMLEHKIFSGAKGDYMQANLFRNIFYTAVVIKEFSWAEKFADDYAGYLLPEQKEDMLYYTKATLCFERKEYEKALEMISKVNYNFFVFKYEAKVLTLKLYFEMRSYESAVSLIDSFSHFLAKNKIVSGIYKEQFMSFLKYLKILIKLSNNKTADKINIMELKKNADETSNVVNKRWILEKIEELS